MSDSSDGVHGRRLTVLFGASGGIGQATARRLTARGDRVVLVGRDAARLTGLGEELGVPTQVADGCEPDQALACLEAVASQHGPVDGVVNLIGSILLKPAHRTSLAEWDEVVRTNLGSAFAVVRAAATTMRKGGSVVLLSTAAARIGLANHEAIAAAKAGVIGLARSAAASYAGRGIRVNVVAPGLVKTGLSAPIVASEASRKASEGMHPLGRLGEPEDVASAIVWLLGAEQGWVTGQVLGVDGGLGTVRSRG